MDLSNGSGSSAKGVSDSGDNTPVSNEELAILGDVPPVGEENKNEDEVDEETENEDSDDSEDENSEDEEKETSKSDEDDEEEVEEEEEEEEEEKEASDDNDEVEQPSVNFKAINKEFPGIFKKHPELRAAVARDFNYRKLLPTIEDAQDAVDKARAVDYLGETISTGNYEPLLKSIGREPENLRGFAKNVLPTLAKIDPSLRSEALTPAIKTILRNALATGNSTKNASLANAAQHIAAYLFEQDWKSIFEAPRQEEKKENPETEKLKRQLQEVEIQREREFIQSAQTEAFAELEREARKIFIKSEKEYEKKLTERQKNTIFEEARRLIGRKLSKNDAHQANMDRLLVEAKKAGWSSDRKPSVKNAYLGRAKNLLSDIQLKLIREELGIEAEAPKTKAGEKRIPSQPVTKKTKTIEKDPNKAFKNMSEEAFLEA